jgi:hypothetical protein
MTHSDDRDDLELLGSLPHLDVEVDAAERIRLRARAELARTARPIPIRRAIHRAYRRSELVLVGALAASYLALALRAALIPFS